jgi:predicted HTH transcriptional regulator
MGNQTPEGLGLEYKSELYDSSDRGKNEFLKDVSSFANVATGDIIIGMTEDDGLPTGLPGVAADLDSEILRLTNLLRDRIEPRILGVGMRRIPLSNGLHALLINWARSPT